MERVLFCPVRDANPFFHLFESAWMLAGSSDAKWLDRYVSDFSARYAEPGGHMHGAYGQRWRANFCLISREGARTWVEHDQLVMAARQLRENPASRQVVITMWDPQRDLNSNDLRDRPCNTQIYLRVRQGMLDMTVLCRSNDIVWGAYGANAVHMSVLQEYMAAMTGTRVGVLYQVSNNWHGYMSVLDKMRGISHADYYSRGLVAPRAMFNPETVHDVESELQAWMQAPSKYTSRLNPQLFDELLVPMSRAHDWYKVGKFGAARSHLAPVVATDWQRAAAEWIERRERRHEDRARLQEGSAMRGSGEALAHVADTPGADDGRTSVERDQDTPGDIPVV
jgi:thymidylate synthase